MGPRIDEAIIHHIARLSRIELDPARVAVFVQQFGTILAYFDKLSELETAGVEPLTRSVDTADVMADDEPAPCLPTQEALAAAPERDGDFFKVPKVLGDS